MRRMYLEDHLVGDESIAHDEVAIVATRDELALLANAIGEALEAVEDWEFETRLGVSTQTARSIRAQIATLL